MMCLKVEEIIYIHQKLIERTGGSSEIRDMALLESAVYSMDAAYDGVELYPSIPEKAARLAYGLISNHAFVDGNKRIGVMAMLLTLRLNHVRLQYTQAELIALGLYGRHCTLDRYTHCCDRRWGQGYPFHPLPINFYIFSGIIFPVSIDKRTKKQYNITVMKIS